MSPLLRAVIVCGLAAVAVVGAGCKRVPPSGGATGSKADKARKQAEALASAGAVGAAVAYVATTEPGGRAAGPVGRAVGVVAGAGTGGVSVKAAGQPGYTGPAVKGTQQPKAAPRPGSPPVIRERVVSSIPYTKDADADADAVEVARGLIEQRLAELDPPVPYRPSANEVRYEFLRKDSRTVRPPPPEEQEEYVKRGVDGNWVYVEYDVEVTGEQVRALRTRDRVSDAVRLFAGVSVASLLGFLFLRFDERTKGYLTRWLAVAAVVLAAGAGGVLYFV